MSHTKYALLPGVDASGESRVRVVTPGSSTFFLPGATPQALDFLSKLTPDERYTYVLVNAMGYSEFFGSNSNADWYGLNPDLDFNGLLHAPVDFGLDLEKDRMQGRDWAYGYPTFYGATAYAHHKNTNPQELGFGDVIFVGLNPKMKRIELVIRVFNEEAIRKGHETILNRLRAGERVDVSMGTRVPFDLATCCTDWDAVKRAMATYDPRIHKHPGIAILAYHKTVAPIRGLAPTPADYCACFLSQKNKILPNGRKIFVYNDFLRFFDISFVWIGADKTARVMWFLMPNQMPTVRGPVATPEVDANTKILELIAKRLHGMTNGKTAAAKGASMDKTVPGGVIEQVRAAAANEPSISAESLMRQSADHGASKVLSSLAALGIVLKPSEFTATVAPHDDEIGAAVRAHGLPDTLPDVRPSYDHPVTTQHVDQGLMQQSAKLAPQRSSFAPFLGPRMKQASLKKTAAAKKDSCPSHPGFTKAAAAYAGYRLSLLETAPQVFPKGVTHLPGFGKVAGDEVALLLLGLAPVLHLLASHLADRGDAGEEIGSMGSFVAQNPTFTTVGTIGAGLRAAMGVEAAGGIGPAAAKLLRVAQAL